MPHPDWYAENAEIENEPTAPTNTIRIVPARVVVGPRGWFVVNAKLATDPDECISGPVLTQEMAAYCADECDAALVAFIRRMLADMRSRTSNALPPQWPRR